MSRRKEKRQRHKKAVVATEAIQTLSGALQPNPGLWHFSWALADRTCKEVAWPKIDSPEYAELATWIACISELELSDIFNTERHSGKSANHAISLDNVNEPWRTRWSKIFASHRLGDKDHEAFALVSLTYCTAGRDSRRVIVAYQCDARVMYPIWWDRAHQVSGTSTCPTFADDTHDHGRCHHLSQRAVKALGENWGY